MNQRSLEQSWHRLESAIGKENIRTQSHRSSRRSINSNRYPNSRCSSITNACVTPVVTRAQLQKIYKAKCEDIEIPVLNDQEARFLTYCQNNFQHRHFQMKESGLSLNAAIAIGKVLKSTNFAFVNLSKNTLGDDGAFRLLKEICDSNSIVHLDLSNNDITPEGFIKISKILSYHPSLTSIDLSSYEGLHRNRMSTNGAAALSKAVKNNKILQFLNISGTSLGEGIELLAAGLENNHSLVSMDLSNNSIQGRHIEKLSKVLVSTSLKDLNLASNKIADEGCEYLANMMIGAYDAGCPLVKFNLSSNQITHKGAGKLFHALRLNGFIKTFNISGNLFNQGLSLYFPMFLSDNTVLSMLNLSNCMIKSESFQNISEGILKNKGLEMLDLSKNKIEDAGVIFLAEGLAKNKALKSLDLTTCHIKDNGAAFLANALKGNTMIASVNLKDNSVKDGAGELFVELTRINKNLLFIGLDLNPLHLKYVSAIKTNVKENIKLQKKKVIPQILGEIERIKAPIEAHEAVNQKIKKKLKEKLETERKFEIRDENYEDVKVQEEKRLKSLQDHHRVLKEKNMDLSKTLDSSQTETIVKNI